MRYLAAAAIAWWRDRRAVDPAFAQPDDKEVMRQHLMLRRLARPGDFAKVRDPARNVHTPG